MGVNIQHVVVVALFFVMFAVTSSDLAVDRLHVLPSALPRWARNLTAVLARGPAGNEVPIQRLMREAIDCFLIALTLVATVFVWLPGRYPDVDRAMWALFVVAALGWTVHLFRLPRR